MTRISPAPPERLEDSKDLLAMAAAARGVEANSLKVMARQPTLLQGFMGLSAVLLGPGASLDPVLRQMIAHI
ncbi:MAG: carboxymuconolactone decarboxylase family protein, partial [Pseudomonadota bacterium]